MSVLASQITLALLLIAGLAVFLIAEIRRVRRHPHDRLPPSAVERLRAQAYELRDDEGKALP